MPKAHWLAGLASWQLGRPGDAAGHFERALKYARSDWGASAAAFCTLALTERSGFGRLIITALASIRRQTPVSSGATSRGVIACSDAKAGATRGSPRRRLRRRLGIIINLCQTSFFHLLA